MKSRPSYGLMLAVFILLTNTALGTDESSKTSQKALNSNNSQKKTVEGLTEGLPPDPAPEPAPVRAVGPPTPTQDYASLDEVTKVSYQQALRAYYNYQRSGLEHRTRVFDWQLVSSQIIFFVVIGLVLAGLYFSWLQFHSSHRVSQNRSKAGGFESRTTHSGDLSAVKEKLVNEAKQLIDDANQEAQPFVTQIDASLQGIRVSSPVLGVIILALSFLFFYLYLRYVYPISEIF